MNPFLLSAICIFCFMCFMFVIALIKKDNSIVDIGWGIGFIIVALVTLFYFGYERRSQKLVTFLTIIWGLRLSLYILLRNWGKPEDFRYAKWRKDWGTNVVISSFFQVFMLQGCTMFINTLPIVIVNSAPYIVYPHLRSLYPLGCTTFLIGFLFEAIGDWEMYMFKTNPHKHGVMNEGLWRYTRHPNYFGEAMQWWGVFIIAIPSGLWYISLIAPVTITFFLLRVSGVTLLEKKYEGNDAYTLYKRTTSSFVPWFPKKQGVS